jgi:phosphate transport system protein
MTRESFGRHIRELEADVKSMSIAAVIAINRSVEALKNHDIEDAKRIIEDDKFINQKRWEIEAKCIDLIARQQPVATDLREMIAVLSIITDLERIGDHAEGTARIVLLLGSEPHVKQLVHIPQMAAKTVSMLERSIEAFINRDAKAAEAICNEDDVVDNLYEQVYHDLLQLMIENPQLITRATYLIWAAHNIERIADRVTNICERIVFLVTGTMREINVSRY